MGPGKDSESMRKKYVKKLTAGFMAAVLAAVPVFAGEEVKELPSEVLLEEAPEPEAASGNEGGKDAPEPEAASENGELKDAGEGGTYRNFGYRPSKEKVVHHPVSPEDFAVGAEGTSESRYVSPHYTEVNDQGQTGACWAFANVSSLEGCLNKKYGGGHQMSWKNLAYYCWHKNEVTSVGEGKDYRETVFRQDTFNEGPGDYDYYAAGGRGSSGIDCVGNDTAYLFLGGMTYYAPLLYWQGRGLKNDAGDDALNVDLNNITSYFDKAAKVGSSVGDEYRVKDIFVARADRQSMDTVKQLIKEYGAGAISYYADTSDTESVYVSDSEAAQIRRELGLGSDEDFSNHSITIVGWDDDYSASNFGGSASGKSGYGGSGSSSSKPEGNGAWICINSWGTGADTGTDNGKTYISYYDASIDCSDVIFYDVYKKGDAAGTELWTDNSFGPEAYDDPASATDSLARGLVYKADKDQTLTSVSIMTAEDNASYTLSVYGNPAAENGKIDISSASALVSMDVSFPLAGLHTLQLDKPVGIGKDQSVVVVFKPKNSIRTFVSEGVDKTEDAYWDGDLYLGHCHYVCDASGQSLYESENGKLQIINNGDIYVRVYSNNGVSGNAVTFEGENLDLSRINPGNGGGGSSSSSSGGSSGYGLSEHASVVCGNDTYEVSWTKSVPYTGYPHIAYGTVKNHATPDVQIEVKKNGTTLHPADYKIKFKNNKFLSGYRGKYPEFYVILGRGADRMAKSTLKKSPMRFDIRKADLSSDLDLSKFEPALNRYWDRVTRLYDIYDRFTGSPVKYKISKDGVKGDIRATVEDHGKYITIILEGINNCTGTASEEFEVEDEYGGYGDDYGYGGGGYGGGYEDDYGYGGGGYGGGGYGW